mmetsp:Transcript_110589/g.312870  ORF Transcript_110589/g.312870 Transcript_110589/m.312870 type:complete len:179 (-) Transcript_110589:117-653(-)
MEVAEAPPEFCGRAEYYVDRFTEGERGRQSDPATWRFGGPTLHKRVFCYCEYRLQEDAGAEGAPPQLIEGAILQENSARRKRMAGAPRWFHAVQLPINEIVDRAMCTEYLMLTELSLVVRGAAAGPVLEAPCRGISGEVRVYASGPPCVSCLGVFRQFQLRFPRVGLAVAFGRSQVVR